MNSQERESADIAEGWRKLHEAAAEMNRTDLSRRGMAFVSGQFNAYAYMVSFMTGRPMAEVVLVAQKRLAKEAS